MPNDFWYATRVALIRSQYSFLKSGKSSYISSQKKWPINVGVEVEKASFIVAVGRAVGVKEGTIAPGGIGEYVASTAGLEPTTGVDVSREYGKIFPNEASDTAVKFNKRKRN